MRYSIYFFPALLAFLVYWIAFFPAAMTPDSLAQWDQAHTRDFNDWHPVVFTWIIMFLTTIWDSPGIVSLFQIITISVIFSYCMVQFEEKGIPRKLLYGITIFFIVLPVTGIYTIIIWKDVLYSAFLMLFSMHIFNIVHSKGEWIKSKLSWVGLFLSSAGIVFFRHNGFPVFILVMVFVLVVYRKQLKSLIPLVFTIVGLHLLLTGPIFKALDVEPSDPNEALSIPTQQIALIVKENGEMTEEQREYVNNVFPIELWKERYNPYNTNPIKFSWKEYDREFIFNDFPQYVKTWLSLWIQNPIIAFDAFFTQTSLVWQINQPADGYTDTYVTNIYYGNPQQLENEILSPFITKVAKFYLETTKEELGFIIWRPAVYFSFILLFSIVAIYKNGLKYSLIALPVLLNILSVMAALPAQDFRYLFSNTLVVFLLFVIMLIYEKKPDRKIENE